MNQRVASLIPSQAGHMPGLQARSPEGATWEATTHWCFSPSPSLPLSLKWINKTFFKKIQLLIYIYYCQHDTSRFSVLPGLSTSNHSSLASVLSGASRVVNRILFHCPKPSFSLPQSTYKNLLCFICLSVYLGIVSLPPFEYIYFLRKVSGSFEVCKPPFSFFCIVNCTVW